MTDSGRSQRAKTSAHAGMSSLPILALVARLTRLALAATAEAKIRLAEKRAAFTAASGTDVVGELLSTSR